MKAEQDKISDKQISFLLKLARSSKLEDFMLNLLLRKQVHKLTRVEAESYIRVYLEAMKISKEVTDEEARVREYKMLVKELNLGSITYEHR